MLPVPAYVPEACWTSEYVTVGADGPLLYIWSFVPQRIQFLSVGDEESLSMPSP